MTGTKPDKFTMAIWEQRLKWLADNQLIAITNGETASLKAFEDGARWADERANKRAQKLVEALLEASVDMSSCADKFMYVYPSYDAWAYVHKITKAIHEWKAGE